jgi:hypothetical protein
MSEAVLAPPKPKSIRSTADKKALAHIEKWMSVIHELNLEQAKKASRS